MYQCNDSRPLQYTSHKVNQSEDNAPVDKALSPGETSQSAKRNPSTLALARFHRQYVHLSNSQEGIRAGAEDTHVQP